MPRCNIRVVFFGFGKKPVEFDGAVADNAGVRRLSRNIRRNEIVGDVFSEIRVEIKNFMLYSERFADFRGVVDILLLYASRFFV